MRSMIRLIRISSKFKFDKERKRVLTDFWWMVVVVAGGWGGASAQGEFQADGHIALPLEVITVHIH